MAIEGSTTFVLLVKGEQHSVKVPHQNGRQVDIQGARACLSLPRLVPHLMG